MNSSVRFSAAHQKSLTLYNGLSILLQILNTGVMESMEMFYKYLRELIVSFNIERLESIKKQLEDDLIRLSDDERLQEKYSAVCKALEQLHEKKTA